jgi:peptide/nickel transport system substrate-binding protein
MITRRSFITQALYTQALTLLGIPSAGLAWATVARAEPANEIPSLAADVAAGRLPPAAQRLPHVPMNRDAGRPDVAAGRHGGEMHVLMGRPQDTRMITVMGYSRLVMLTPSYELVPDILADVTVEDGRVFTMKLREGHRWSDGHPFTAEDFRYWWEDVANNARLSPTGPAIILRVNGELPTVSYPDATTVRYAWASPNPFFLPALAGPAPLFIYRPAHYLRNYHERYAERAQLQEAVRRHGARGWAQLHNRLDNLYRADNPELPTLDPWVVTTPPPADRFVFVRNAYFHRVDGDGRQLPYIDRVIVSIADGRLIPAKTGSGESDLQARSLSFANYTFLRQAARRNHFRVELWRTALGARLALYPNLNVSDPAWRTLMRDVRFRRALSLAIDRREINQVVYFGLALPGQNTLLPQSPLFRQEYRDSFAQFDVRAANALLDEIGLTQRDDRNVRLLQDGRPLEVIVESPGEDTEQTDVLELVHDSWLQAGIKLYARPSQLQVFRNRVFSGESMMTISSGLENGVATPAMSPAELAPTDQQQLQWPRWGQYVETQGRSGEAIDIASGRELQRLNADWRDALSDADRTQIWQRILEIHAAELFTIGILADVRQPVVISNKLRNVPAEGLYNWDPGAFFGIYRPDLFWFDQAPASTASR